MMYIFYKGNEAIASIIDDGGLIIEAREYCPLIDDYIEALNSDTPLDTWKELHLKRLQPLIEFEFERLDKKHSRASEDAQRLGYDDVPTQERLQNVFAQKDKLRTIFSKIENAASLEELEAITPEGVLNNA